ncbi:MULTISPECIES: hypothetical protein [Rhodobacterales]|uniref:hypothetical protein n=1 Tax=Rhodobacterales TaxID=204455 RepID=UPI0011BF8EC9|nr:MULTISPECIES: hypothetical protein [Rhodobacterales]MDO6591972.1 hypothetical protein [Yoonia sp. 1_MG-2023]
MFKPLIAGVTALSLTFATAMPAQADGIDRDDAGKIIFGIVALAALGAAIENRNDNDQHSSPTQTRSPQRHPTQGNDQRHNTRLPSECLRDIGRNNQVFTSNCLQRNDVRVNALPNRCEVRVFTGNRARNGFDPTCLRQEGYRIDRRH